MTANASEQNNAGPQGGPLILGNHSLDLNVSLSTSITQEQNIIFLYESTVSLKQMTSKH